MTSTREGFVNWFLSLKMEMPISNGWERIRKWLLDTFLARINMRIWWRWFGFDWVSLWKAVFDTAATLLRTESFRLCVHPHKKFSITPTSKSKNPKGHQKPLHPSALMGLSFGCVQGDLGDLMVAETTVYYPVVETVLLSKTVRKKQQNKTWHQTVRKLLTRCFLPGPVW